MNGASAQLRCRRVAAAVCASVLAGGSVTAADAQAFAPPKPAKYGLVAIEKAPASPPASDPATLALAPDLSLETRRYLLYLYARLNHPEMAEALAARILKDNFRDQQTLQVLASMYVERKDANKALRTARQLVEFYPNDDQSAYFLAAAYSLAGQYAAAEEVLQKLQLKQFKGKLYPYETDLAAAALKAGDWYRAMLAYQELLRHHQLSEPLRLEARKIIEGIYRQHLPQLAVDGRSILLKSGQMYRTWSEYRQHLSDRLTGFARVSRSDVKIEGQLDYRERWTENQDAVAGLDAVWTRRYQSSIWAGGGDHGAMGGAKLTRASGEQRFLELELQANERASDGLLIESLNGRQHRLSLNGNWLFTPDWLGYFQAGGREVTLDSERLGRGYGVTANLERLLLHDSPEVRVGYRAIWMEFDRTAGDPELVAAAAPAGATAAQKQALLENTILGSLHREGLYLTVRDQLSGFVFHQTTVGADYSLDRGAFEYYATTGLRIYPRKSLELRLEVGYTTSARTADQDSDQWQISAGLTFWF